MSPFRSVTREIWQTFGIMLLVIFVTEATIMIFLPKVLPTGVDWVTESIVDAWLLTMTVAPVFWLLLVRPLRRLAEFRTEMLAMTISAQEKERRRIAGDLHDGVGQALTSLLIGLRTVSDSESLVAAQARAIDLRKLVVTTLEDVKRLARGLRPSVLDDLGLGPALERLISDVGKMHSLDASWDFTELEGTRLPSLIELTVYRIVQEALANVAKHARATTVHVGLERSGDQLSVRIRDDGCGFVAASARSLMSEGHWGLAGMQERASLMGGSVELDSQIGEGTTVVARLPLGEMKSDGKNSRHVGR